MLIYQRLTLIESSLFVAPLTQPINALVRQKRLPVHEDFSSEPGDLMRKKESRQDTRAAAPEASAGPAAKSAAPSPVPEPANSEIPQVTVAAADLRPIEPLKVQASQPPAERSFGET